MVTGRLVIMGWVHPLDWFLPKDSPSEVTSVRGGFARGIIAFEGALICVIR